MILYLIRHGQTDVNKENKIQGRHGLPLNETGKLQAYEAQKKLKNIKFDLVFSSPQERAVQTVLIATGKTPIVDERLNVYDVGEAENLSLDQVELINDMIPNPSLYKGVENTKSYIDRICNFMDELLTKYKDKDINILIGGHTCTTGCITAYIQGMLNDGNFLKLANANAEVKIFKF